MNISQKLASVLLVMFSLLAIQAQAQIPLQGTQLTAYQALSTTLGNNPTANEAADELAVQAARDAGLSDESIAGAMQENGRSAAQQAAALLPANPTQAQVTAATGAILNSTNAQGIANSTTTTASLQTTVSAVLINSGVDSTAAVNLASTATNNTNNAAVPQAGGNAVIPPLAANALTDTTAGSSGPAVTVAAAVTETPLIPVADADLGSDDPETVIPEARTTHNF